MSLRLRLLLLCLLITHLSACANETLVALVPDPDGRIGHVSVANDAGAVAISAPYQATTVEDAKAPPDLPKEIERERINRMFGDALSIQPDQPLHFPLFFSTDVRLTPQSLKLLPVIVQAIRTRKAPYLRAIGHTDTIGRKGYNIDLSFDRVNVVKSLLMKEGVDPAIIFITGEGEENPWVPTADEVLELRNRWVEVIVR